MLTDRNLDYGDPEDNFRDIAAIWTVQLGSKLRAPITPAEVAALSIGIKIARLITSPRVADHWVDVAGYAACGAACKDLGSNDEQKQEE